MCLSAPHSRSPAVSAIGVHKVPRIGGPQVEVFNPPGVVEWFGDTEVLAFDDDGHSLRAYPYAAMATGTVVDLDTSDVIEGWAAPNAYFAAGKNGLMRIER
jgi:hypothetical protein